MVVWLFLVVSWVCLRFVTVVFADQTQLLFLVVKCVSELRGLWCFSGLCGLGCFRGLGGKRFMVFQRTLWFGVFQWLRC